MNEDSPLDHQRLCEALAWAEQAIALSEPNPRVGCVVGSETGAVFGTGFTQEAGGAHAEVMALRAAAQAGHATTGATAWVSLEPCAHHGRTPPCCDALIAAGLARVVVAAADPFEAVNGQGIARLRAAGIQVSLLPPNSEIALAARELNIGFFSRVQRGRPWLRLKIAASLDGRTALHNGTSQWITGPAARADGHRFRRRAGAVLSGIGTVLEDNPRLDVREVPTPRQPMCVVVDSQLQTPPTARLFEMPGPVWIYAAQDDAARRAALQARGADIRLLPNAQGKVDLQALLQDLGSRGINELHVEAGHKLNASLLQAGLVDELLIYLAPKMLGPGREMAALMPLTHLADALAFEFTQAQLIGSDLRVMARPRGRASP